MHGHLSLSIRSTGDCRARRGGERIAHPARPLTSPASQWMKGRQCHEPIRTEHSEKAHRGAVCRQKTRRLAKLSDCYFCSVDRLEHSCRPEDRVRAGEACFLFLWQKYDSIFPLCQYMHKYNVSSPAIDAALCFFYRKCSAYLDRALSAGLH